MSLKRGLRKEKGAIRKKRRGRLSIALIYPNSYYIGMSNLGFQVVYEILNRREDIVAERFFLPEEGERLCSVESNASLDQFDIIAFSISFENDYINILRILELGGIPLLSEERKDFVYPIVMAGGVCAFLNPEPLAMFTDLFFLGEAEKRLDHLMDLFIDSYGKFSSKEDLLYFIAKNEEFVYVPNFYRVDYLRDGTISSFYPTKDKAREKIKVSKEIPFNEIAYSKIISSETEFSEKILIELGRGCGRSCRFCAAGYVYRPPRYHDLESLKEVIDKALEKEKNLGLLSASIADVPNIEKIMEFICEKGGKFSISSVRVEAINENFIEYLKTSGQRRITIAPEAGSERLRRVINKHLTEEKIINAIQLISKEGLSLKLYFMIGLPTERWEDIESILRLVKLIRHHMVKEGAKKGKVGRIRIDISCFVPKPFTPFQWIEMDDLEELKKKQKWLLKEIRKEGGIRISFDVAKWAYIQALLSLGDRRVGSILLLAHKYNGNWKMAFRHSEINPEFFVYRRKDSQEILPWDFIDAGIKKAYLLSELKKAFNEEESDICTNHPNCKRCGVCNSLSL